MGVYIRECVGRGLKAQGAGMLYIQKVVYEHGVNNEIGFKRKGSGGLHAGGKKK